MEKVLLPEREKVSIERSMLVFYLIYSTVLTIFTIRSDWPIWLAIGTGVSCLFGFFFHMARVRTYEFRAWYVASTMQISVIFMSICTASYSMTVPLLLAFTVAYAIYSMPELIYLSVAGTTFLSIYHIFVAKSVSFVSEKTAIQTALEIVSIYFSQHIVFIIIKKRLDNIKSQQQTILSLQDAEHSKDDFLANVSHEIRTPVNTICGMSEIVLREDLAEGVRADIFSIQAAGRNLLSIVSDVLDFTEMQSGKMTLAEESYNITSTLNDIINMSMARISGKRLELIVDCDAGIPSGLAGDEQKIRRVIMNLVNNALKFTVEGCVSLQISSRRTEYGINLIVCVKDTGIGMDEESLEKLFTSFNQVDTRRNRQEGGIGLGLAISQAIVDMMGGFIMASSKLGKGSEIQFTIPQKVVDDTPIAALRDPESVNVAVYIDMETYDRPDVREEYGRVIVHMISQLRVRCHVCQNLAELKHRAQRETFTHIFISIEEYEEDSGYFDGLSKTSKVIAVIDRLNDVRIANRDILRLYKPFFILPVVMVLNDEKLVQGMDTSYYYRGRFVAPDVNVLLVDDNLMNIRVLEGLLAPYQVKVAMATSGAEALEKIDSMEYDAVFLDHMMPEMDGIETLHRIRQKQGNYFKKIPIVAVTANAVGGMREVYLNEGFQDFMAKPIEMSVLDRVLRRNLPQEKLVPVEEDEAAREEAAESVKAQETEKKEAAPRKTDLPADRFDEEAGVKYCGGFDNYIRILQINSESGEEEKDKIQACFDQKDWKNYTIFVHALKSTMRSIGVEKLSAMAKELEQAGKQGREDYILENHSAMMEEYAQILELLKKSETVCPQDKEEGAEGLEALDEADMDRLSLEFEDAAYAFDGDQMNIIAEYLMECSYKGHPLKKHLEPIARKIEMMDYLSAAEAVSRLKDKWKEP